jgi:hypothetical protein
MLESGRARGRDHYVGDYRPGAHGPNRRRPAETVSCPRQRWWKCRSGARSYRTSMPSSPPYSARVALSLGDIVVVLVFVMVVSGLAVSNALLAHGSWARSSPLLRSCELGPFELRIPCTSAAMPRPLGRGGWISTGRSVSTSQPPCYDEAMLTSLAPYRIWIGTSISTAGRGGGGA